MSQERFTITSPAYGSDGSSTQGKTNGSGEDHVGATFLNDPLTVNSTTNISNSNADGAATPKLYEYAITTGTMTATSTNGTVASADSSAYTSGNVNTDAKAEAVERSNMRFHNMLARLGETEEIVRFEIDSETLPAGTGVPTASSTFTVTYAKQPTHPTATYTTGALAVKRLAAEGISFNGVATTQMRHVYYPNKLSTGSVNKVYTARKDITVPILDTDVATLYGKMGCTETIVNATHSSP
tara:strand:+ start:397 stop:1119 length:723 start_codon:yes stop_codon:yes gene_type:complete